MSLISKLLGRSGKTLKQATVTLIGPSKAGKTTLVRYLETGETVNDDPHTTLGIEVRKNHVEMSGLKLKVIDSGGQEIYAQAFWELAVQQANSVIFVIDATVRNENNTEVYEITKNQFSYALDIIPEDMPLLIVLNKQDLVDKNPMNPADALKIFNLGSFENRTVAYLPISAKYGTGVEDALHWLIEKLEC
jgi:ADP-ribosylation factor related protein 1